MVLATKATEEELYWACLLQKPTRVLGIEDYHTGFEPRLILVRWRLIKINAKFCKLTLISK